MKGKYLSEIIDVWDIKEDVLNLIYAPCGCGKTTFAKTELIYMDPKVQRLKGLRSPDVLYLIDSAIGKEQLLQSEGATFEYIGSSLEVQWKLPGITVMTYAGYATLCEKAPEHDRWKEWSLIICDELHNAIKWSKWETEANNIHERALGIIAARIFVGGNLVVALSATPNAIKEYFDFCLNEIELYDEPRHYENENVIQFSDLRMLLNKIDQQKRGIVYIPRIRSMLEFKDVLDKRGFKTSALWSIHNQDYPLTKEQLQVREYIITYRKMPPDIDVLFINKSCETSVTIGDGENTKNLVDFMIICSSDSDTQIQVRGRYRNDLNELYLFNSSIFEKIELDKKWLNKPLSKVDKELLAQTLGYKGRNGRLLKWTSLKSLLIDSDYRIEEKRTSKERFSIITQ